jgi:hypothetical protein
MENFDELQSLWGQQTSSRINTSASQVIEKAEANMKKLKMGQYITIGILSSATIILLGYFLWVGVSQINAFTIGLGIMVAVITLRILLEWISVNKLRRIKPDSSMIQFSDQMAQFYVWRRKINMIIVPIIYIAYTLGFSLMLPAFRENLSYGMYLYVLISGFGSLVVLAFFISRQIKKETQLLKVLKSKDNNHF